MTFPAPRSALPALVLALAAVFLASFASPALAGTLQVRDSASILSPSDRSAIQSEANGALFDVRVLTSSDYADQPSFSRYVGEQVNEPNMIVIGIDPVHHHTQVHFGTGSQIPQSAWPTIERAGNAGFREQHWSTGVIAIVEAATSARGNVPNAATHPQTSSSRSWGGGLVVLLILGIIGVVVVVGIFMAIRWAASAASGGSGYGSGYGPQGPGYGGGGYGPGYGPGYNQGYGGNQGGIGAVGGGLIGAGLGGVAGYELGKAEGEREERERGGGSWDNSGSSYESNSGGGSYDAGGGGSSWDSGGSSDTGGGSDFGGGGGGDSGGGGGGGSDW